MELRRDHLAGHVFDARHPDEHDDLLRDAGAMYVVTGDLIEPVEP